MEEHEHQLWRAGQVDPSQEHFELLYWRDKWEEERPPPLARVGRGDGSDLIVEFLDAATTSAEVRNALTDALDFYATYDAPLEKWSYLVRHATSGTANLYSDVTWVHLPGMSETVRIETPGWADSMTGRGPCVSAVSRFDPAGDLPEWDGEELYWPNEPQRTKAFRLLQSWYRTVVLQAQPGPHSVDRNQVKPVGSELSPDDAAAGLNFLHGDIASYASERVVHANIALSKLASEKTSWTRRWSGSLKTQV
jgi:hypothetical protein